MELCNSEKCTGCCACRNICPQCAIEMEEDYRYGIYPRIITDKCVECGLCKRVCPVFHPIQKNKVQKSYAAWAKDPDIVHCSASSGIVTVMYKKILSEGGVIFGTRYKEGKLVFDYIESIEDATVFRGSKYIHAYVENSYQKVKKFLRENRKVLFVGTPCQIAGLKNFLQEEYKNLYTIDLICHGVTPQMYLNEYLSKVIGNISYDKVLFRGREGEKLAVYKKEKLIYVKNKSTDLYYSAYVRGLLHRENCYSCQYTSQERIGDITVGDFWGIDKTKLQENALNIPYVSLLFLNNRKGEKLFDMIQEEIIYEARQIEECLGGNQQLSSPCSRHLDRDKFLNIYKKAGFYRAMKKTTVYKLVKKNEIHCQSIEMLRKIKYKLYK